MKQKLFTIFLLFFTSQVFAEECQGTDTSKWNDCYGTYYFSSNSTYIGGWKNGKLHGQGTFNYPSGNIYVGEWKNGNRHGHGTLTISDGTKYVGEYKNGNKHGPGTHIDANGEKRVGEYKADGTFVQKNEIKSSKTKAVDLSNKNKSKSKKPCKGAKWNYCYGTVTYSSGDKYDGTF